MSARARLCCLDLDTFFVSVERLLNPDLIGEPVIVGAAEGSRGVVTAASYEVRPLGVRSGMSMRDARKLAPDAIYVSTRHGVYTPYAQQVKELLQRYTPAVRTASIDEFYLDFSGCETLHRCSDDVDDDDTIERTIRLMRQAIQDEIGLPASAGVGATRRIAKMASGAAKPAGVYMVRVGEERDFVDRLPVRKFPGIGPVAEAKLVAAGIETLGQLIELPPGRLRSRFNTVRVAVRKAVLAMEGTTLGRDRPAFREHDPEGLVVGSISNEQTFHADIGDRQEVEDRVRGLCERVCWRARKRDVQARTITLKLRYADFHTITRSRTIPRTNAEARVFATALGLLRNNWDRPVAIRLVGVGLSNLVVGQAQLPLPMDASERLEVGSAIDTVREKFGYDAIRLGRAGRGRGWLE